jgi:hypothetical protein
MAEFTPEQTAAIIKAFNEKTQNQARCPGCGRDQFVLGGGVVYLPLFPSHGMPQGLERLGAVTHLPSIPIVCTTCGNTQIYNVFTLGVGEVIGLRSAGRSKGIF